MTDAIQPRTNWSLWFGLVLALAAVLANVVFFANPPAQSAIPWISIALGIVALVFIALGVRNLFAQPRSTAARVLGVSVAFFSLLCSAGAIFAFVHARGVPPSSDAPQVGQHAPDFTLPDTNNQPVSLSQLFAPASAGATAAAPHAVLLVFYRGYW